MRIGGSLAIALSLATVVTTQAHARGAVPGRGGVPVVLSGTRVMISSDPKRATRAMGVSVEGSQTGLVRWVVPAPDAGLPETSDVGVVATQLTSIEGPLPERLGGVTLSLGLGTTVAPIASPQAPVDAGALDAAAPPEGTLSSGSSLPPPPEEDIPPPPNTGTSGGVDDSALAQEVVNDAADAASSGCDGGSDSSDGGGGCDSSSASSDDSGGCSGSSDDTSPDCAVRRRGRHRGGAGVRTLVFGMTLLACVRRATRRPREPSAPHD
jgi:hypothetical protein